MADRVDAAATVGELLSGEWPLGVAWQTLCHVIFDDTDDIAVRAAAIRALAKRAHRINSFECSGPIPIGRSESKPCEFCARSTLHPRSGSRLDEQLTAARGPEPTFPLANLALTFGHDQRIVATYNDALTSPDCRSGPSSFGAWRCSARCRMSSPRCCGFVASGPCRGRRVDRLLQHARPDRDRRHRVCH